MQSDIDLQPYIVERCVCVWGACMCAVLLFCTFITPQLSFKTVCFFFSFSYPCPTKVASLHVKRSHDAPETFPRWNLTPHTPGWIYEKQNRKENLRRHDSWNDCYRNLSVGARYRFHQMKRGTWCFMASMIYQKKLLYLFIVKKNNIIVHQNAFWKYLFYYFVLNV